MAASRVQRWAVFLAGYDYEIKHIRGVDNTQADSLSRIPLPRSVHSSKSVKKDEHSYLNYVMSGVPTVDCNEIEKCTNEDRIRVK